MIWKTQIKLEFNVEKKSCCQLELFFSDLDYATYFGKNYQRKHD